MPTNYKFAATAEELDALEAAPDSGIVLRLCGAVRYEQERCENLQFHLTSLLESNQLLHDEIRRLTIERDSLTSVIGGGVVGVRDKEIDAARKRAENPFANEPHDHMNPDGSEMEPAVVINKPKRERPPRKSGPAKQRGTSSEKIRSTPAPDSPDSVRNAQSGDDSEQPTSEAGHGTAASNH